MTTPHQLLARRTATAPAAPFVTWYGPDGRVELSTVTFSNAVAKLCGLLDTEIGVTAGEQVRLDLPLHWQLSVWLAATDALGLAVTSGDEGEAAVVATMNPDCDLPGQQVLVPSSPLGLPGPPAPPGVIDQGREAPGQPDIFPATGAAGRLHDSDRWLALDEAADVCRSIADRIGLSPGGRLGIVDGPADRLLGCYLLPLVMTGSVVLRQDPTADVTSEGITASW